MGALEARSHLFPPPIPHGGQQDTAIKATLRHFYYPFWDCIALLLNMPHVFVFVTSKTQAFGMIGQQLSPSRHEDVVLRALSLKDLDDVLVKSRTVDGTPLTQWLKFGSDALRQRFLERLEEETAGQPRFVYLCLESFCRYVHDTGITLIDSVAKVEDGLRAGDRHTDRALNLANYVPQGSGDVSASVRTWQKGIRPCCLQDTCLY